MRALDHDEACHATYTANWPSPALRRNLESVKPALLADADAWWMSPPCQPYTVRGQRRDLDDPRSRSLVHLVELLGRLRPRSLAMENVPGFPGSRAHALLRHALRDGGYHVTELELCPSELGVPMRRPRWYLLADRDGARVPRVERTARPPLRAALDATPDPSLWADEALATRYAGNLALCDADDDDALAHVFTAAYGVSPVYSGSWLATPTGPRRFSPAEILRLMGFPEGFSLVAPTPRKAWKLVGNSLSVDAVRCVLGAWVS